MAEDTPPPQSAALVSLDERRLLVRHRRGDSSAFGELVSCYRAPVYGYLTRCGVDPTSRDDLFQDIFTRVHRAAATYQPDRPLKPWLFTIVANVVRNHYRRLRVQRLVFPDRVPGDVATEGASAQQLAEARETATWLEDAIAALPLAQREVLVLSCAERLSHEEIAQVLDVPTGTVKTHLHRARKALAEGLARRKAAGMREVSR